MKYLKLKFRNAGFFTVTNKTSDFVFDLNGKRKRKDVFLGKQQKVSISVNQVSNMLHVLMGERPSATYRETNIKRMEDIFDIANNSYIKIDNPRFFNKITNKSYYQSEVIMTRKSAWNSFKPSPDLVHWERVKNFLTDDYDDCSLFNHMVFIFSRVLGYDVLSKPSHEVFDILREDYKHNKELIEIKILLRSKNKTPIIKLLEGGYNGGYMMNSNSRTLLTINSGVDRITRLSGSIFVPIDDFHVEKIRNFSGTATLLDGGFVWIEDLVEDYEVDMLDIKEYLPINKLEEYESNS